MSTSKPGRKPAPLASSRMAAALNAAGRTAAVPGAPNTAAQPQPGQPAAKGGRKGPGVFARLAELYADMERAYAQTAHAAGLT